MGQINILNDAGTAKLSLQFTGTTNKSLNSELLSSITSDVQTQLDSKVSKSGDIVGILQIQNPTQTGYASTLAETVTKSTLSIKTHSTDSTLTTFGAISGGDAYIQRSNGPGTSFYNIQLNPFGGAVTTPYQPAFRGYVNPDQTTDGEMLSNWNIQYNRGNHFSGGRLTAPVKGVYHVSAAIDASTSPSRVRICVNGGTWAMNEPTVTNDGWETINITTDVYCNAGDYISLFVDNGSGSYPYHMGGGYWGWFNIHLVG